MSEVKDLLFGQHTRGPRTPPHPTPEYWASAAREIINFIPRLPIDVAPHEFIALRLREAYEDGILAAKEGRVPSVSTG